MSIVLDHLTKCFDNHLVVDEVSLEVADGELFVLLGPSGSGKSTILRLIAGLLQPDSGQILLHGRDVTFLPSQKRNVGFVSQNYTLFRHMSAAENIEFGLKIRKVRSAERARRREQLLDLVGMTGMSNRYPDQLSGGQQQRVALARALAYEPSVLLLDEPFGALDVKIRMQLRRSLKEIQQRLGVTAILVTHDQEEAFELADRIGVIEQGRLLEIGTAETLYAHPRSLFVATFLGAGTVFAGRVRGGQAHFGPLCLPIPPEAPHDEGARVHLLFRPEQVNLSAERPQDDKPVLGRGTIIEQGFTGALRRVRVRLPRLAATRQIAPPLPFGEESLLVDAVLPVETPLASQELWVSLRDWRILGRPHPRLLVYDAGVGTTLLLARQLMESLSASVTVLGVAHDPKSAEVLRAKLNRHQHEQGLLQADLRIRFGNPAAQIAIEQAETLYDLVVLAASDQPRSKHLSATMMPVLEQQTEVPLLIVKGERTKLKRMLICTAAGEPGKQTVLVGGQLASRLSAAVTLLYVARGSSESSPRAYLQRAAATLHALDVPTEVRVCAAETPAEGILAEARAGEHDLIVMGSHGFTTPRFGFDDVVLHVLNDADRPVLIVPTERKEG